ncbi:hypothetical protein H257_16622 [Aphanomyces astaci]|uniref:FYVE-type domain-containing protein n=1 Tax=Aphanomyces astaci TaxID=112090 RepID=W4FHU7_APHAT|nr:hypothetical protein H257_16622 [Aphanomyces astaci]ETV67057.1 hypothetical protein H257_16622 [Aphanomyces astaci]|eukprot:XP_009843426.1 hypothetical protein H257_16622 [Aphanomyces astaci]
MVFGFGSSSKDGNVKPPPTPKCPELTMEQVQQLKAVAHMTCTDLVYASRLLPNSKHGVQWTPMESPNPRLRFYSGTQQHSHVTTHEVRFMCCVTTVHAALDDVIDVLNGSTRSSVLANDIKSNLNGDILAKASLKTFKYLDRLKIRLRWMVLKSASPYIPMRDFVFLECQNSIRVAGHAGWACNMHSVALPGFATFDESHNVIRGSFYRTGYVVTETDIPGQLRLVHMMQADFKGTSMPVHVSDMMMQRRVANIAFLPAYFRKLVLIDRIVAAAADEKIPRPNQASAAKHCTQCRKKFPLLGKKLACRLCGEVACATCSHSLHVELHIRGYNGIRVCALCDAGDDDDDDPNDLMRSILTEVLMHVPGTEYSSPSIPPRDGRALATLPRDSDILGDPNVDSLVFSARQPQPSIYYGSTCTIPEDIEDEEPPLSLREPSRGPSAKDLRNMSIASRGSQVRGPRGLDWLDPLDSFRSSVASGIHFSLYSGARSTNDLLRDSSDTHEL